MTHARRLRIVLAVSTLSTIACAAVSPVEVTPAQLVAHQKDYEGRTVATEGRLRSFGEGDARYCVLEDEDQNRIGIQPTQRALPLVGRGVRVVGRFGFDPRGGRFIEAQTLAPAESAGPRSKG